MIKYFNNYRCRVVFNSDIFDPIKLQILVRHSYLSGFIWFYKWHTIGEGYGVINTEEKLANFIKRTFDERNQMRRARRLKEKMKKSEIGYIT